MIMPNKRIYQSKNNATLVDAIDRVLDKGAYIQGDLMLEVAEVELAFISLRLVIASTRKLKKQSPTDDRKDRQYIKNLEAKLKVLEKEFPKIIENPTPEKTEKGLAKLVLTLVELIREVLEREAIRKIDSGELSDTQTQKLGLSFEILKKKIEEMKKIFGIEEDLNIDLGPLGKLL